jgi:hypothetical protein
MSAKEIAYDAEAQNDYTTTSTVRSMLGRKHYYVTDKLRDHKTRYFVVRGNLDLLKTFRTLVDNTTPYVVVDVSKGDERFRAEIEHEKIAN